MADGRIMNPDWISMQWMVGGIQVSVVEYNGTGLTSIGCVMGYNGADCPHNCPTVDPPPEGQSIGGSYYRIMDESNFGELSIPWMTGSVES